MKYKRQGEKIVKLRRNRDKSKNRIKPMKIICHIFGEVYEDVIFMH